MTKISLLFKKTRISTTINKVAYNNPHLSLNENSYLGDLIDEVYRNAFPNKTELKSPNLELYELILHHRKELAYKQLNEPSN